MWREGERARATQNNSRSTEPLSEVTNMDCVASDKPHRLMTRSQKVLQSSDATNTYLSPSTHCVTLPPPDMHIPLSRTHHAYQRPVSVVVEKVNPRTLLGKN